MVLLRLERDSGSQISLLAGLDVARLTILFDGLQRDLRRKFQNVAARLLGDYRFRPKPGYVIELKGKSARFVARLVGEIPQAAFMPGKTSGSVPKISLSLKFLRRPTGIQSITVPPPSS